MKIIYRYIGLLLLGLMTVLSCSDREEVQVKEDYDALFPFKGIEKPTVSYEKMLSHPCDPTQDIAKYKYLGVELPSNRSYKVTLTYYYEEVGFNGVQPTLANEVANYVVRYVGEDKALHQIGSSKVNKSLDGYMYNKEEGQVTFTAYSGYPMYLSVAGVGPTGSYIRAKIQAVSDDGFIESPILEMIEYQNQEGPNALSRPYCEYIILP